MQRNDKCCLKKGTAIKAVQAISICIEKKLNEILKSNYKLFFMEIPECDGWLYAHCMYRESRLLNILIAYHIEKGKYFVMMPNSPYTTNDLVDWAQVSNDNMYFLESDKDKMIELTKLVEGKEVMA